MLAHYFYVIYPIFPIADLYKLCILLAGIDGVNVKLYPTTISIRFITFSATKIIGYD